MARGGVPLVTFDPTVTIDESRPQPYRASANYDSDSDDGHSGSSRKRWFDYVPLAVTIFLILLPHPSLLHVLIRYHVLALDARAFFALHLAVLYALTFLAFYYLLVCAARDPGPVPQPEPKDGGADDDREMSFSDALLAPPEEDDYLQPGRWCRICWAPKPERTHHCSTCGRCVLKMGACTDARRVAGE
jgi:hypothetical protein